MATYNIGRVAYVNKGAYNAATVYEDHDVVLYQNGSYTYINGTPASGNVPTNATYWKVMLDPTDMNAATEDANDAAALANEKAGLADGATTNANNATIAANEAVEDIEDILPLWSDVDVNVTEVEPGNPTLASISQDVDGTHIDLTLPTDMTKWAAVDILASDLDEGESATAGVSQDGTGTHFTVGIPKGDTGDSGTYIGDEEPSNPLKTVWLDTDEPDLMANYQDMMDATQAANDNIIESVGFDEDDMVFTKADTTTHVISGAYSALSGNSIVSVTRTDGDGTPGTTDEYTITYSKEAPTSFTVYNGAEGAPGADGTPTTAANVALADAGSYFTTDNVEAALQETGASLSAKGKLLATYVHNPSELILTGFNSATLQFETSSDLSGVLPADVYSYCRKIIIPDDTNCILTSNPTRFKLQVVDSTHFIVVDYTSLEPITISNSATLDYTKIRIFRNININITNLGNVKKIKIVCEGFMAVPLATKGDKVYMATMWKTGTGTTYGLSVGYIANKDTWGRCEMVWEISGGVKKGSIKENGVCHLATNSTPIYYNNNGIFIPETTDIVDFDTINLGYYSGSGYPPYVQIDGVIKIYNWEGLE